VGFRSAASNLLPSVTTGEVFLHDRWADRTIQIDRGFDDPEWGYASGSPRVSENGRYVLFQSNGGRLVADDTNGMWDVFVHDRLAPGSGSIAGSVVDAASGEAIAGATVAISGRTATSGWDGTYFLPVVPTGAAQVLTVEAPGYETWRLTDVSVGDGENIALDVCLGPAGCGYVIGRVSNALIDVGLWESTVTCGATTAGCASGGYYTLPILGEMEAALSTSPLGYYPASRAGVSVSPGTSVRVDFPLGPQFTDTSVSYWAAEEIGACVSGGIVAGYADGCYHPEWAVARDQMAVYISRALAGGDNNVPEFTDTPTFPDVPEGFWALDHVEYAVDQNVVQGYPEGDYRPELEVSRAQMAVYVARAIVRPTGEAGLADYTPPEEPTFPDVPDTGYGEDGAEPYWAYKHIEYCVENGVVQGYDDGYYHPDYVVTRDQMAVYVARAFGLVS